MRTQRLRRRVRFLVRVTRIEKDTTSVVSYLTGISPLANICSLYAWQTSLPISERQMRTQRLRRRVRFLVRGTTTKKDTSFEVSCRGDSYGNRTHVTAVKGPCLDRLTNGPYFAEMRTVIRISVFVMVADVGFEPTTYRV